MSVVGKQQTKEQKEKQMNTVKSAVKWALWCWLVLLMVLFATHSAKAAVGFSAETFGAIRYANLQGPTYGVGAAGSVQFNKYVAGQLRLVGYDTHDWRGSAVDEGSLLVKATLFNSTTDPKKLAISLHAIGGGSYDVEKGDFGFGLGPRVELSYKQVFGFAGAEVRSWANQRKDLLATVGVGLRF